ncbi:MAG: alpha/beta hydrolase [Gammaproteobacteria bacterium]|nr:alpha/beta hydrolase [Gammaproteobacteria bacterium]
MKSHMITGGGGTQLHLVETGNSRGQPILFIHGFSQCGLAWTRQMNSGLADSFRLVAMDMRGHGRSDKPCDGYSDSKLWADDVHAAIQGLNLDNPILCGFSYGPLVILDYFRHYGDRDVRGFNFVGGVTKLGSEEAASVLTADFLGLLPGFFSADAQESVRALDALLRLCFAHELADEDRYLMLGYNASVPAYVRQALFSRSFDNDDLLPKIRKPVLITHGADDAIVKPAVIDQQMSRIAHAEVRMMANAGHACFWDDAATYNRNLQEFVEALNANVSRP